MLWSAKDGAYRGGSRLESSNPPIEAVPAAPARPVPKRPWLAPVVIIVAVLSISALAAYYRLASPTERNIPAHVVSILGNGSTFFEIPLMTMFTAPPLPIQGFHTNVTLTMATPLGTPASIFTFRWENVTGIEGPVHFVLSPNESQAAISFFRGGVTDGFLYFPAGNCTTPCRTSWSAATANIGSAGLYSELWSMKYSVLRMAATVSGVDESWIQVNYSIVRVRADYLDLPFANTTAPSGMELLPVGSVTTVNYGGGGTWSVLGSIHDFALPSVPFRHANPISLRFGSVGNASLSLTSEFRWGPSDGQWVGFGATPNQAGSVTFQFYVDSRFGGLLVQFLP